MGKEEILVVEDEEDIQEFIRYNLLKEGYGVKSVLSGEQAMESVAKKRPDLVLLDLMLPGQDGLNVCKRLRNDSRTGNLPIIMLTAKSEETDVVSGLEVGADDYISKPFSPKVLIARVRAVLRRKAKEQLDEKSLIQIHDIMIDPSRHEVQVRGRKVELTYTEFRLLQLLARRPGLVYSRDQILETMHGDAGMITDRSIDVQVVGLRKKLGKAGKYVETVRGVGYRFRD